ncbi:hypothetical protein BDU57DRAFT_524953 [Ampelomyces quisqualis]|uniref:Uncharacterized protein n=1 Tax=Ampelomyces quisqualis TaxID=50730 RepID=A0A6A5QA57_AMPQU|nr:hypothetical protein BDU57DRAFT_524953 [Ampelomyces quisqualis]
MPHMPISWIQSLKDVGSAAVQWVATRRGRTMVMAVVLMVVLLGLGGVHHREAISSRYHSLSSTYPWRTHMPHIPSIIQTPFKTPSNMTLRLENGELAHVPQQLKKTTPNFHLVMPAQKDTDAFCKTTLSSMILNYPPPTIVNLNRTFENDAQWARDTLLGIRDYLENGQYVQNEDLVLIVDGESSWFQLPSDVIIKQYARVLEDANARLLEHYGADENGYQRFNQTIVFGAEKMCEDEDMACKYAPPSMLPANLYGKEKDFDIADRPVRYLNAKVLMGPAKDLKVLYQVAAEKLHLKHGQSQTIQSIFTTLFGEQQLIRNAVMKNRTINNSPVTKLKYFLGGKKAKLQSQAERESMNTQTKRHEFSIGLDYTHTLFQPFAYCNKDELLPLLHRNSTDLSKYQHSTSWSKHLDLPAPLHESSPPFWRLDLAKNNPSPNEKPAYIDKLAINSSLDSLPKRKIPWSNVPLVQNTYTGSIPAILLNDPSAASRLAHPDHDPPTANITFEQLWFSPFRRALLRNYFRTPQSPVGYHNSLVGGDRTWDSRGGRGGIWTATESAWLPWGEVDGVCGSVNQLKEVFGDGQGVWLHEIKDGGGVQERVG